MTCSGVAAYAAYFLVLFILMPSNPDHNDVPTGLLREFRAFSLAGAVLFWAIFGLLFAELLGRHGRQRTGGDIEARQAET